MTRMSHPMRQRGSTPGLQSGESGDRQAFSRGPTVGRRRTFAIALLFVCLSLVGTYPIFTAPTRYAYFDHPDALLNMWIFAWDAHQMVRHPLHLFDANIFFPQPRTLAYSENLLGYLPLFGTILWLGGSPALAFNVVLLFSFAAAGFAMYLLARHLTGRDWPALVAGLIFAFSPYHFAHIPQIQLEATAWLPLTLLFLHRFIEGGRRADACWVGLFFSLQTLCCIYYGLFLASALVLMAPALLAVHGRIHDWRRLRMLGLVFGVVGVLLLPVARPYLTVHQALGIERPLSEIVDKSGRLSDYVASPSRVHQMLWARRSLGAHDYLFPGIVALLLAAAGIFDGLRAAFRPADSESRRILMTAAIYAGLGFVALLASFGPEGPVLPVYRLLYAAVPPFHGLRAVSRLGILVILAISVLAALGCAALEQWGVRRRQAPWRIAVPILIVLETAVAPIGRDLPSGVFLSKMPPVPPVYHWLAEQRGEFPVVEIPMYWGRDFYKNAPYVYWSTIHWKCLINGYSGFAPPSYIHMRQALQGFPDETSRRALLDRNVRFVLVHWEGLISDDVNTKRQSLLQKGWLKFTVRTPDVDVFEVTAARSESRLP